METNACPSLQRFIDEILPLLRREIDPQRMIALAGSLVEHEKWNSFDRFHDADRTLAAAYEAAGAKVETWSIPTGGKPGSGRWIIPEALDIRAATLDLLEPHERRLLDWRDNPWHIIQWSTATPEEGIVCELVVLDDQAELERLGPRSLAGKMVLTRLGPRVNRVAFCAAGAVGIVCDKGAADCPDAIAWEKFGWGGLDVHSASARLIGLVLSPNQGDALRKLLSGGAKLKVKVRVDARRYSGAHQVVSGIMPGRDDPQSEIWAVAHSHEPGALDNASGVAVCVEISRILNSLIASGQLPRPRRSIRLLSGYECYGFFHYLEHRRRFETPLAGICLDTVGARPDVCDARLDLHRTVPSSASFVDDIGETLFRAAHGLDDAGYQFEMRPFRNTEDTLLGDPRYGFPCPWLSNHPCRGYHSSADTIDLLHPAGLTLCAAASAAYLYYLADAATPQAMEWIAWQTRKTLDVLQTPNISPSAARFAAERHAVNLQQAQRWLWGGDHGQICREIQALRNQIAPLAPPPPPPASTELRFIPIRRAPLAPSLENIYPPLQDAVAAVPKWALYWADGKRSLAEISDLLATELWQPIADDVLICFFQALAELQYVQLLNPSQMIGKDQLLRDLRKLGAQPGMDVMVHSSLSTLGPIQGGADTVVDAMLEAISPGGTLLSPSFNHMWAAVFNPLATRTTNGAIPEAIWRRANALRSLQPSHSVAAIGPGAARYTAGHLDAGIWGQDSPIGRLIHGGGYILSLGVRQDSSTAYHVAEISLGVHCLDMFASRDRVLDETGTVHIVPSVAWRGDECPVDPSGIDEILDANNQQSHGKIGRADATLAKAIDVFNARRRQLGNTCKTCMIQPHRRELSDVRRKY